MARTETIHFRIVSPRKVLFENDAKSVSSKNSLGNFDILPGHANFMTIIENSPLTIKLDKNQTIEFDLSFGVIYSVNGVVNIYTDLPENKTNHLLDQK
jgi:F0F1-type ATP synthase epsilon subunit